MVSFHTSQIPTQRNVMEELSKKRKWEDEISYDEKPQKAKTKTTLFGTQLNPETPLPLEWQRCLDIKSGQIYFYNTRTQKRTSKDPRLNDPEPQTTPVRMSLDLELNLLPCGSPEKINQVDDNFVSHSNSFVKKKSTESQGLINRSPSWLTFDVDQQEMVTAVCKKCHMLVMMYKSSSTCPNCKFVNPIDETPYTLFKKRLSSF
ncbi:protein CURLY FLAG LEAF 1-like isoform X1 [Lycium ferocissimum]|uniref:protein CURLY FLAG LEAF 1-like isoform X1 n=1 Tax=Lycium ferocissimum TaxID=112874 RepID=UPI0028169ABC|nr:protein CURLY FLAG LEAF 1-like isoform X1 [Lycium ferocissimum]